MNTSKFLSKAIGFYLLIISLMILLNTHQFLSNVTHLIEDPALMCITGFFTLILGLLMVLSHNVWTWNWRVLVTLICWITLLKGITILILPQHMQMMSLSFLKHNDMIYVSAATDFILGVLFVYFGYRAK